MRSCFSTTFRSWRERERIKMGESPQILKDKLNLVEMFLRRYGGQMYGSSRKFKSKKPFIREWRLSGETGSCRLQSGGGLSHFFSPRSVSNGEGDGVGLKEVELWTSDVLSQALKSARLHSSRPEQGLLMCGVCSVELRASERIQNTFSFFSPVLWIQDWLKADWKLWGAPPHYERGEQQHGLYFLISV